VQVIIDNSDNKERIITMKSLFESVAGSIVGTDHRKQFVWKNNQDAYAIRESDDLMVAVVADGCGEGAHSELGARLGAHLLAHRLTQLFGWSESTADENALSDGLERLRISIILSLQQLLMEIDRDSRTQSVVDNFLFTLLSIIITPTSTYVIGIGDGVYAINREIVRIGPFPRNEPPYLAYGGLVKSNIAPELCRFTIHKVIPTSELQSACIGTDGIADFGRISNLTLPGKNELVGSLSQFWTEDKFFKNSESLRRRLNLINNCVSQPDWDAQELNQEHGRLADDTTMVVIRRRPQPQE
jgi:hypothetical protein